MNESILLGKLHNGQRLNDEDVQSYMTEFHNTYSGITEQIIGHYKTAEGQSSYQVLLELVSQPTGKTIVDLACGSGPLVDLAAQAVGPHGHVIGIDISEGELQLARIRMGHDNVTLICEPAQHLTLPTASADGVLCHLGLMAMRPIEPALQEVQRILKPGGIFGAVIGSVDGHASDESYSNFCGLLDQFLRQAFPSLAASGLADQRLNTVAGLTELLCEQKEFGPIQIHEFVLLFDGSLSAVARDLTRFFYSVYLLPKSQQQQVEAAAREILTSHATETNNVRLGVPQTRIWVTRLRD